MLQVVPTDRQSVVGSSINLMAHPGLTPRQIDLLAAGREQGAPSRNENETLVSSLSHLLAALQLRLACRAFHGLKNLGWRHLGYWGCWSQHVSWAPGACCSLVLVQSRAGPSALLLP